MSIILTIRCNSRIILKKYFAKNTLLFWETNKLDYREYEDCFQLFDISCFNHSSPNGE